MSTPNDIVAALLARKRKKLWFREDTPDIPPGQFPPGWRAWFAAMPRREGAVTGATASSMLDLLAARTPKPPPPRTRDLGRLQTLAALVRPQWHPAPRGGRGPHRVAAATSALLHLLLIWVLLILPYGRLPPPPAQQQGDSVVEVEFIGEGTPDDSGGGAPAVATEEPQPAPAEAARPAEAAPKQAASATPPAPASEATPTPPEPQPEPIAQQPLQVTETPVPDTRFVLPPTTPRELQVEAAPVPRPVQVQARTREIELAPTPTAPAIRRQVTVAPPQPSPRVVERQVQAREIPTLVRPTALPQLAQQPAEAARVAAPTQQARTRDVPLAPAASGEQASTQPASGASERATAAREGASASPAATPSGQRPDTGSGTQPQVAGRGSDAARPGAPPGTRRADDWGDSNGNRPGGNSGQAGLFNADGSPRLPPGAAAAGGGFPPGSDDWTRDQLDRYGTFATRPPLGYEPTRFDQYWIPSGTLLQEWVRRGVKSMAIPIPGTSKKINCVLSILQLGGGCSVTDANMQDQEAVARPPPDIPYKPELQEGGN